MKTEMTILIQKLKEANIPFELTTDAVGNPNNQVWYPNRQNEMCDVICHKYSYGGEEGLLEIMGLLTEEELQYDDSVAGYLTADDVFSRIKKDYEEEN